MVNNNDWNNGVDMTVSTDRTDRLYVTPTRPPTMPTTHTTISDHQAGQICFRKEIGSFDVACGRRHGWNDSRQRDTGVLTDKI